MPHMKQSKHAADGTMLVKFPGLNAPYPQATGSPTRPLSNTSNVVSISKFSTPSHQWKHQWKHESCTTDHFVAANGIGLHVPRCRKITILCCFYPLLILSSPDAQVANDLTVESLRGLPPKHSVVSLLGRRWPSPLTHGHLRSRLHMPQ